MEIFHPQALSDLPVNAKLFFVGIGGVSMTGLALMAKNLGYRVAGSDSHGNPRLGKLQAAGIPAHEQHHSAWIDDFMPDLVIYTAAIKHPNPELTRSEELSIPAIDRAEFLGWLTNYYSQVINVAGTHGKTTTTAMIAQMLIGDNFDPSVHLGAEFSAFNGSTVRTGKPGELLVSEACEYNSSLLNFRTDTAVLLNIDNDHLDYFGSMEKLIECFAEFIANIPAEGKLVVLDKGKYLDDCLNAAHKLRVADDSGKISVYTFNIIDETTYPQIAGQSEEKLIRLWAEHSIPDYAAYNLHYVDGYPEFDLYKQGQFVATVSLSVPGRHNVLNALAALAACDLQGANSDVTVKQLKEFTGADGRFSRKGKFKGADLIADYAHHPSATAATIAAAKQLPYQHTYVVYQPLTYGRVKELFDDYVAVLKNCEKVLLIEIYSDRERSTLGMSSKLLVDAVNKAGGTAEFFANYEEVKAALSELCHEGDLVLFLGPEEVRAMADRLAEEA